MKNIDSDKKDIRPSYVLQKTTLRNEKVIVDKYLKKINKLNKIR
jgi:hypothetical protein